MKYYVPWFCILFLGASGCGESGGSAASALPSCEEDMRDEPYVAGATKVGNAGYNFVIVDSEPAPPTRGDNLWRVRVLDDEDSAVIGMTLTATNWMPDHGHGSPILPVVTEIGEGEYSLDPVNLFMPGYWEITVSVVDPNDDDRSLDSVVFKYCIEG